MHALVKSHGVVQFLGFSSLPNIGGHLFHDLSVDERQSTESEVSWGSEGVGGFGLFDRENGSVVESNVRALFSLTDSLVAYSKHMVNSLLAVSSLRFLLELNLKSVEVFDHVLIHLDGLHVHSSFLKRELLHRERLIMTTFLGVASTWATRLHIFAPFLVLAPFPGGSTEVLLAPRRSLLQTLVIILDLLASSSSRIDSWHLRASPSSFALNDTIVAFSSPVKDILSFSF
jgi:hypothetical protein